MLNTKDIFIIAEAGVNHNGVYENAIKLVDIAKEAGADAVKFQTWKTEDIIARDCSLADYQNIGNDENQYDMLKKLELKYSDFERIKEYCDRSNILFISTPDDIESAAFLDKLQPFFKIGSGELTNNIYLEKIAKYQKEVILSTGMGTEEEINAAIKSLKSGGLEDEKIHLLHATSAYPVPDLDANIQAIITKKKLYSKHKVGFSDHTLGNVASIMAIALGVHIIEKHFTIDKSMNGPDHKASLSPNELQSFITDIRRAKSMLGSGDIKPMPSERNNINVVRKKIFASKKIHKGDLFSSDSFLLLRSDKGICSGWANNLIGKQAKEEYLKGDIISFCELV